jgi:spermidine/putrescine transport system ATP-binding protein
MNVRDNVSFGLRMRKTPPAELQRRVDAVMDLVQIAALARRKPSQLSGGQKQRVALARAVVNEPQVLLLDEPLGALDLKLRKELQVELLGLQRRLGITFIYVTHDQEEALVMSDRIAVMNNGRIEQLGEAEALYERPRTRFVARFLGSCNLLARDNATFAIRPEKISLLPAGAPLGEHRLAVRVEEVIYVGAETHYLLRAGQQQLRVEVMNVRPGHQGFDAGQEAVAHLPPEAWVRLDD